MFAFCWDMCCRQLSVGGMFNIKNIIITFCFFFIPSLYPLVTQAKYLFDKSKYLNTGQLAMPLAVIKICVIVFFWQKTIFFCFLTLTLLSFSVLITFSATNSARGREEEPARTVGSSQTGGGRGDTWVSAPPTTTPSRTCRTWRGCSPCCSPGGRRPLRPRHTSLRLPTASQSSWRTMTPTSSVNLSSCDLVLGLTYSRHLF